MLDLWGQWGIGRPNHFIQWAVRLNLRVWDSGLSFGIVFLPSSGFFLNIGPQYRLSAEGGSRWFLLITAFLGPGVAGELAEMRPFQTLSTDVQAWEPRKPRLSCHQPLRVQTCFGSRKWPEVSWWFHCSATSWLGPPCPGDSGPGRAYKPWPWQSHVCTVCVCMVCEGLLSMSSQHSTLPWGVQVAALGKMRETGSSYERPGYS